ncbi:hypothetical protein M0R04_01225 [Candidatus Dojkabacteria bacterium]|jgi:hypothetical protein|nr:hypothetical protein [Candidatus Dojkabacteria bacterium]
MSAGAQISFETVKQGSVESLAVEGYTLLKDIAPYGYEHGAANRPEAVKAIKNGLEDGSLSILSRNPADQTGHLVFTTYCNFVTISPSFESYPIGYFSFVIDGNGKLLQVLADTQHGKTEPTDELVVIFNNIVINASRKNDFTQEKKT